MMCYESAWERVDVLIHISDMCAFVCTRMRLYVLMKLNVVCVYVCLYFDTVN